MDKNNKQPHDIFPITVEITTKTIDNADIHNTKKCIGTLALESLKIPEIKYIAWNNNWGIVLFNKNYYKLNSYVNGELIDLKLVIEPITVEFRINKQTKY